jgi:hypothetical protein
LIVVFHLDNYITKAAEKSVISGTPNQNLKYRDLT